MGNRVFLAASFAFALAPALAQTPADPVAGAGNWLDQARTALRELVPQNNEEYARITPAFKEEHLRQVRQAVQKGVLEVLNGRDGPAGLPAFLKIIKTLTDPRGGLPPEASVAAYPARLKGIDTVVVGYPFYYGGAALSTIRAVIDGYRNTGAGYELAAETGLALENCGLSLTRLESPRPSEAWFLARGHLSSYSYNTYHEVARIYSFDGYQFKELWAPEAPLEHPEFKVSKDSVVVTYPGTAPLGDRLPLLQETIQLTVNGAISTTLTLTP